MFLLVVKSKHSASVLFRVLQVYTCMAPNCTWGRNLTPNPNPTLNPNLNHDLNLNLNLNAGEGCGDVSVPGNTLKSVYFLNVDICIFISWRLDPSLWNELLTFWSTPLLKQHSPCGASAFWGCLWEPSGCWDIALLLYCCVSAAWKKGLCLYLRFVAANWQRDKLCVAQGSVVMMS